jgi:iron-sulfur cluster assembly protein
MVTLTTTAVEKLGGILEQKGLAGTHSLRVFVRGGGCGGMQYGMTFDQPREATKCTSRVV